MLVLTNVYAGYGQMGILKGINLEIKQGEIVALIGANGAGKTTTLNAICGIVQLTSGNINFEQEELKNLSTTEIVQRGITQVPEGRRLFPEMTVLENLEIGAYLRKDKQGIYQDIERVYHLFPVLKDRQKQYAGTLSGGEQQMLAIARGLMSKPKLLLLDEPSLGLAPKFVHQIFNIIQSINKQGTTIFLVEQNAHISLHLSDRGYVMETGKIILSDKADNLLQNELVKKAYLGEI